MVVEVVYLLHRDYGEIDDFYKFRNSITSSKAITGVNLSVILLLKGLRKEDIVGRIHEQTIEVPNKGRDIYSYYLHAAKSKADFVFYFNTSSVITSKNYISDCLSILLSKDCGMVSATASKGGLADTKYHCLIAKNSGRNKHLYLIKSAVVTCQKIILRLMGYQPSIHLRTNAFGCSRKLLLEIFGKPYQVPKTRLKSLFFESGKRGLSGQILSRGLKLYVIDRNGQAYDENGWMKSETYAYGSQINLAVEDNRTIEYDNANHRDKYKLYVGAWGNSHEFNE